MSLTELQKLQSGKKLNESLECDFINGKPLFDIQVDIEDDGANGLVVRSVAPGGTFARDGRILPGDYLVKVNGESMRNISHSQVSQSQSPQVMN